MSSDPGLDDLVALQDHGRMAWSARERGWVAIPDEVLIALVRGGFEECKRATTTSRRDLRPTGGLWQGVNHATGSVASAIWVARPPDGHALLFIAIDGEAVDAMSDEGPDPFDHRSYEDEGGES